MDDLPDRVVEELARAEDARADARLLIEHGGTASGAVNRLYYATFHGIDA